MATAAPPLAATPAGREQRKTVTVLFCDVTGSTSLGETTDPEALRALLARYFERMKGIVESHGGTVEKFIGDAVMAVFGVPQVHEDDALRAVRAAIEMRDAMPSWASRRASASTPARWSPARQSAWPRATRSMSPPASNRRRCRRNPHRPVHARPRRWRRRCAARSRR